jgi:hypothetical protein|nr:MAG TPA: nucelotide kinase [Crassvirales sp.]
MDKLESIQVGGEHYKGYDYQPLDLIENLNLSFAEGCILKYVIRFRDKGGKEDLLKALDYARRELLKELKKDPKDRGKQVNPRNVAEVLSFCAQDRILEEDRDFIFDIANYLHSGLMVKVADTIMTKIKSTYNKEEEDEPVIPKDPKKQLRQIKEAAAHVLEEIKKREDETKDGGFLEQSRANTESYIDMKLMLEIIRDTIKL